MGKLKKKMGTSSVVDNGVHTERRMKNQRAWHGIHQSAIKFQLTCPIDCIIYFIKRMAMRREAARRGALSRVGGVVWCV